MNTIVCRFLVYIILHAEATLESRNNYGGTPLTVEDAFGLTLQDLRKVRKISQEELGFESGCHRTYISQLERGRKSPSLRTIFQLAVALKTSPSEIVLRVEQAYAASGQDIGQMGKLTNEDNPDRASD